MVVESSLLPPLVLRYACVGHCMSLASSNMDDFIIRFLKGQEKKGTFFLCGVTKNKKPYDLALHPLSQPTRPKGRTFRVPLHPRQHALLKVNHKLVRGVVLHRVGARHVLDAIVVVEVPLVDDARRDRHLGRRYGMPEVPRQQLETEANAQAWDGSFHGLGDDGPCVVDDGMGGDFGQSQPTPRQDHLVHVLPLERQGLFRGHHLRLVQHLDQPIGEGGFGGLAVGANPVVDHQNHRFFLFSHEKKKRAGTILERRWVSHAKDLGLTEDGRW